ncbi:MAG: tetratricopeptide repeat protein [Alphaproteobacteria bacterium]|nr:tetratricopeptide repeat protein [Alphaproteobacteria bacterium]
MLVDRYQGRHSTQSQEAVSEFEKAVFAVAAHRPGIKPLKAALAADEDFVAALALKGLGVSLLCKAEDLAAGRAALDNAKRALIRANGGTEFERTLVEALGYAANGAFKKAASRLEARLADHPTEFLCLKLSNALRFMTGECQRMREVTGLALRDWREDDPGYGFAMGLHAFGLEENGAFAEAEQVGLKAVAAQPADVWGIHAVSHVMEMRHRPREGARWLQASRPLWPLCNNFGFHMAWHLALFHLDTAEYDAVLDLYDRDIRPTQTDDFRDMANAASMLWRLQQEGIDVGDRWQGLHTIAFKRREDTTYVFASLHYLLALIGAGDTDAARELVNNLRTRKISVPVDEQSAVADEVGIAAAEAILHLHTTGGCAEGLSEIARRLPSIGGSRAQRDVFMRTLVLNAAEAGEAHTFTALNRLRSALKAEDRFARLSAERLSNSSNKFALQKRASVGDAA